MTTKNFHETALPCTPWRRTARGWKPDNYITSDRLKHSQVFWRETASNLQV